MTDASLVDLVRELAPLLVAEHGERLEQRLSVLAASRTGDREERVRVYRDKASGAVNLVILTPQASETVTLADLSSVLGPGKRNAARKVEDPESLEFEVGKAESRSKCIVRAVLDSWAKGTPDSRVVEVSLKPSLPAP